MSCLSYYTEFTLNLIFLTFNLYSTLLFGFKIVFKDIFDFHNFRILILFSIKDSSFDLLLLNLLIVNLLKVL